MNKQHKILFLIFFLSLILVGCQHSAKTEHWKIQVNATEWIETETAVSQLLENTVNNPYCCQLPGPYLAVYVTLTNISDVTLYYPEPGGTFYNSFITDQQGNIFYDANDGMRGVENYGAGMVIPGRVINDVYIFAVSGYSGNLEMRISEGRLSKEAAIPLNLDK